MYELIRPLLFKLDPEQAHNLTFRMLTSTGGLPKTAAGTLFGPVTPKLATTVGRVKVAGPVGLAAGLDKNAEATAFWPSIGFGFVEVGTVTAKAQPGNPKPRLFDFQSMKPSSIEWASTMKAPPTWLDGCVRLVKRGTRLRLWG